DAALARGAYPVARHAGVLVRRHPGRLSAGAPVRQAGFLMHEAIAVTLDGALDAFRLDVDFSVPMHGITALFGPSGCGKTSILRSVAGLNRIPGRIAVGGEIWQDDTSFVPTHRRALGYVFQEASLFQHLSVRRNLTYGERRARD